MSTLRALQPHDHAFGFNPGTCVPDRACGPAEVPGLVPAARVSGGELFETLKKSEFEAVIDLKHLLSNTRKLHEST